MIKAIIYTLFATVVFAIIAGLVGGGMDLFASMMATMALLTANEIMHGKKEG